MREADNLTTFKCRMSWKSGSLNILELSGPHRACYGNPLPLLLFFDVTFKGYIIYVSTLIFSALYRMSHELKSLFDVSVTVHHIYK